jgi:hypothetical protein
MMVFFMICQALCSQLLLVMPQFQHQLEHAAAAAKLDTMPTEKRAAESLGKMLDVSPSDLCLHRLPKGGLSLRLYPETGRQPSAQRAQELIGNGVSKQSETTLKECGLDAWRPASLIQSLYETIALCRLTRDERSSSMAERDSLRADMARSRTALTEAEGELERCIAWHGSAEKERSIAKEDEVKVMMAKREALMKDDVSDDECREWQQKDDDAARISEKAQQNLTDAEHALEKARAAHTRISEELKVLCDAAVPKEANAASAEAAAVAASKKYQGLLRGPMQPHRGKSAPPGTKSIL